MQLRLESDISQAKPSHGQPGRRPVPSSLCYKIWFYELLRVLIYLLVLLAQVSSGEDCVLWHYNDFNAFYGPEQETLHPYGHAAGIMGLFDRALVTIKNGFMPQDSAIPKN